jgi:hypothetical protein
MGRVLETGDDLSQPIIVATPCPDTEPVHEANTAFNRFVLSEREVHGKRIRVRVAFEVYGRAKGGGLAFTRLRGRHVLLSLPNSAQADLAIDTVAQLCASMDGKFLARRT